MFNSIKTKIMAVAIFPLVVAQTFIFNAIWETYQESQEMKHHSELALLIVDSGGMLHELQKERGISSIVLNSQGERFVGKLQRQRTTTDNQIDDFQQQLSEFNAAEVGRDVENLTTDINHELSNLKQIRNSVDAAEINAKESLAAYSTLNNTLQDFVQAVASYGSNAELTKRRLAYLNFVKGKEQAGIERAVLANAFTLGHFSNGGYSQFTDLIAMQNTYFDVFKSLASAKELNYYGAYLAQPAISKTQDLREIAHVKGTAGTTSYPQAQIDNQMSFGVGVDRWFTTITAKIDLMRELEIKFGNDLNIRTDELQSAVNTKLITLLVLPAIITAMVIFAVYFVAHNIAAPLRSAVEFAENISNGDLTGRIDCKSKDEIGTLSNALNHMVTKLKDMMQDIDTTAQRLTQAAGEMSHISSQTSQGVRRQQSELQQVSAAMTEMSQTVAHVFENAERAKTATHDANNEATDGRSIVDDTTSSIKSLKSEVDHASTVIKQLESDTSNIESVLDVIGGIAEQTNLLALNAAIEAARAGAQGRGFAVVADEVRTLASRTQAATLEIQSMIENLQRGAAEAVGAMKQGSGRAEQSVDHAGKACNSLESIANMIASVAKMNDLIASSSEQQSTVAQEIDQNIISINNVADETAAGASQTETASGELSRLAENLQQTLSKFVV